ncbi:MAG: histidine kinase dimerization/phosphoacceptor domain -containing protein, partial [Acetobacterales bacterium]
MTDVPLPPVAQYFLGSCLPGAGCLSSARFRGRRKSTGVKRQSGAADSAPRRGQPTSLDEVAAREANHRIMNNLSVLRSLLQMKRRRLKDENASQILDELVMRLEAMTIVHRQLAR